MRIQAGVRRRGRRGEGVRRQPRPAPLKPPDGGVKPPAPTPKRRWVVVEPPLGSAWSRSARTTVWPALRPPVISVRVRPTTPVVTRTRLTVAPSSTSTAPLLTALVGTVTTPEAVPTTTSTDAVPPLGRSRPAPSRVTTTGYVVVPLELSGSCPSRV